MVLKGHAPPPPIQSGWIKRDGSASGLVARRAGFGKQSEGSDDCDRRGLVESAVRPPTWDCFEALTDLGSLCNALFCNKASVTSPARTGKSAESSRAGDASSQRSRVEELETLRLERQELRAQLDAAEHKRRLNSERVLELAT